MEENFYHTKETVAEYTKQAAGYDGQKLIENMRIFLPDKSTLLELGTGPGNDLDILKKYFKVTGSDFSNEFLDAYRAKKPNADLLNLNAVTLETDRKFDAVYSNKVLHHLTDEELRRSIASQFRILKDEGIICHSFWRGDSTETIKGLLFNYHSLDDLRRFFATSFHILRLEIYTELEKGDSLLLIAQKP